MGAGVLCFSLDLKAEDGEDGENSRASCAFRVTVSLRMSGREGGGCSVGISSVSASPGLGIHGWHWPTCPRSQGNLDIPTGSAGMRPLHSPGPGCCHSPGSLRHRPGRQSKQTNPTLVTKLFPINPPLPAALRKKLFFFSIDWWWLETTPCPSARDVCPWLHGSCSSRERADIESPFIEAEPFQAVPCWFFTFPHFYGKELNLA